VLMSGDSTAVTLGLALSYWSTQSHDGLHVIDEGTEGCGVTRVRHYLSDGNRITAPSACNPSTPGAMQWPAVLARQLRAYRPKVCILLAGRWEVHDSVDAEGRVSNIMQPNYAHYVQQQMQRYVTIAAHAGSRVVLMTAPYYDSGEQPNGQPRQEDAPSRVRAYNQLVRAVARANPQTVSLVTLNAMVSPQGKFTTTIGNLVVRAPDGVHFPFFAIFNETAHAPDTLVQVEQFSRWIGPQILPTVVEAAQQP